MGFESLRCTAPDAGGFAAGDVLRDPASVRVRVNPLPTFSLPRLAAASVSSKSLSKSCASAMRLNVRGRLSGLAAVHRLLMAKKSFSFTCCMHCLQSAFEP